MIQRASASQKRLNEFLHLQPKVSTESAATKQQLKGEVRFHKVDFIYEHTGIAAVKDFDLHIKPGQRVAIVGRTGSGKTTVAQLLMRMFDVSSGSIELDGIPVKEMDLQELRRQISYVPQDGFLFSDTVENNIAFGSERMDTGAVREAARLAAVDRDIINFPKGYETEIGERGVTLSGGQKQRISIARALMKKAPILILDDCLSAVDARTEKEIIGNLKTVLEGRTSILITHRIFSLLNFDTIIVMDHGVIAEQGRHEELLSRKGLYFKMHQRQLQEDVSGGDPANLAVEKT
jgi:ATP-binding cassette subfamily B protein